MKCYYKRLQVFLNIFLIYPIFYVTATQLSANNNQKQLWNSTQTDLLKRALLLNYDKFARPAQHTNVTKVLFDLTIRHVNLDEVNSIFTVHAWTKFCWTDDKLKWNSSDYGDLHTLHLADHEVWQPDIILYNNAAGSTIDHYGNTHLLVHEDGTVLWVPPSQFITFCNLNLKYWPFDTQTCSLKLGSWTYDGDKVDLQMDNENNTEVNLVVTNTEWEVVRIEKQRNVVLYACCVEPYLDITIDITVARHSPTYKAIVMTPACVIIFLILSVFCLPPQAGEKILLNGCIAIIICIFLIYFSYKLPPLSENTPLVVLFYSNSLYMVCGSTIISVIVIHIARTKRNQRLPWFMKKPLMSLSRVLFLNFTEKQNLLPTPLNIEELREQSTSVFDDQNTTDDHQMIAGTASKQPSQDWLLLAVAIDRISFILYSIIFIIQAIVHSI